MSLDFPDNERMILHVSCLLKILCTAYLLENKIFTTTTIQRYRKSQTNIEVSEIHMFRCLGSKVLCYITKFWTHTVYRKYASYEV